MGTIEIMVTKITMGNERLDDICSGGVCGVVGVNDHFSLWGGRRVIRLHNGLL